MSRFLPWLTQKQVSASISAAQAERLVQETCVAELVHDILAILTFGCVWIWARLGAVAIHRLCPDRPSALYRHPAI